MKRCLCISAFVVSVALLLILGPDRSLPVETRAFASSNEPIKVLGIKLNTESKAKAGWLDELEVQIENTSGKAIKYLLIHVEVPTAGQALRVPMKFGEAPGSQARETELLRPGAKISLKPAKAVCDQMRQQAVASGRVPSLKDLQTSINVVMFADRVAWKGGQLNYPDPANPLRWIAAEELTRRDSLGSEVFGVKYSKASYKSNSKLQPCYRYTGFNLQFCCDSNFVANAHFSGDPAGTVQPNEQEACCGSGDCCVYTDIASCS